MMTIRPALSEYEEAYDRLTRWMAGQRFRGYDPYDGLSTRWRGLRRGKALRLATVYVNKLSPLNLRPLFRIAPEHDHQAMGLVASAALRRPPAGAVVPVAELIERIMAGSLRETQGVHCWNGHPFPVQMRHYHRSPEVPEIIGTDACATALIDLWGTGGAEPWIEDVLREVRTFCLERLFTRWGGAAFFQYSVATAPHLCTYNASAIAARLVLEIGTLLGEEEGFKEVDDAFAFVLERQQPDGRWMYRLDLRSGHEKPQIDFHQGFVLDALLRYRTTKRGGAGVDDAIHRGLAFYRERQFLPDGRGIHRYPRRWPSNIQYQAQGVLTFTRARVLDPSHRIFARQILDWTLAHMRSPEGYFYYLKYPVGANRIPYLRWSNASMAAALAEFLAAAEEE